VLLRRCRQGKVTVSGRIEEVPTVGGIPTHS
jgi:hypothetical protein